MIQRNDPCWCGSGKKYKKCHLKAESQGKVPDPRKPSAAMIKTPAQIAGMRVAGRFNGELMDYIRPFVTAGISTAELDKLASMYTSKHGHKSACLVYQGYPRSICTSVNDVVCHGIPSENEVLKNGDLVNVDLTTIVNGYYGDSSEMFFIGAVTSEARRLAAVSARALLLGIEVARPGNSLQSIARAIQPFVEKNGCTVVEQFTGHGIGAQFHEHFSVYHHIDPDFKDIILTPGMTLTIEPMINLGSFEVTVDKKDKWTVRTKDHSLSAQYEHTLLITATGCDVLTQTPSQRAANILLAAELAPL